MKQTAVEWLEDQYIKHSGNLLEMGKSFEQAKEMEKEQICDAYRLGWINYLPNTDSEQYYQETFKSE